MSQALLCDEGILGQLDDPAGSAGSAAFCCEIQLPRDAVA